MFYILKIISLCSAYLVMQGNGSRCRCLKECRKACYYLARDTDGGPPTKMRDFMFSSSQLLSVG